MAALGRLLAIIGSMLASRVSTKLGLSLDEASAGAPEPAFIERAEPEQAPEGELKADASPALSMNVATNGIKGRKIAVLAGPGVDAVKLKNMKAALNAAGAVVHLHRRAAGDAAAVGWLRRAGGQAGRHCGVGVLRRRVRGRRSRSGEGGGHGLLKAFLAEAFEHGKAIKAAAALVKAAHLPGVAAAGTPKLGVFVGDEVAEAWMEALKTPRFRNREIEAVAA